MSSKTDPPTEEPNAKRRRIATETSSQTMTDLLPIDVLRHVFGKFLGPGHYRYVAGTCRAFRSAYESAMPEQRINETSYESAAASVPCAELCLREAGSIEKIAWAAARRGKIEVIEWAYNLGFKWFDCPPSYRPSGLFREAAHCGQLEVFEWGYAKGLHWKGSGIASSAAKGGHTKVLEWMREHDTQLDTFRYCVQQAAGVGHVAVLEWLKRQGLPVQNVESCWHNAARTGHTNVLDWLLDNGHSTIPAVMGVAAMNGQMTVVEWALDHQVGWSSKTCACAALVGHLNALKWLRRHGYPWDGNAIHWAQANMHFEVLEWARDNGCPTVAEEIYSVIGLLFRD